MDKTADGKSRNTEDQREEETVDGMSKYLECISEMFIF